VGKLAGQGAAGEGVEPVFHSSKRSTSPDFRVVAARIAP
jgi:hypothetical protein